MEEETKICTKCGIEKPLSKFQKESRRKDGHTSRCKECLRGSSRERTRRYRERHPDRVKEQTRKYKESGKKAEYEEKNKEKIKERRKKYYQEHKEHIIKKADDWIAKKRKEDPLFKLKCQIRGNIYDAFRRYSGEKPTNTKNIVGLELDEFRDYLLQTFANNYGYEWDGKEPVHIDHIIPLNTAKSEDEIFKLCHYTNLQLLKPSDNIAKSDKLDWKLDEYVQ